MLHCPNSSLIHQLIQAHRFAVGQPGDIRVPQSQLRRLQLRRIQGNGFADAAEL